MADGTLLIEEGKITAIGKELTLPDDVAYSSAEAVNDLGQVGGYLERKEGSSSAGKTISFVLSVDIP